MFQKQTPIEIPDLVIVRRTTETVASPPETCLVAQNQLATRKDAQRQPAWPFLLIGAVILIVAGINFAFGAQSSKLPLDDELDIARTTGIGPLEMFFTCSQH